jgi:hypothetical protein
VSRGQLCWDIKTDVSSSRYYSLMIEFKGLGVQCDKGSMPVGSRSLFLG